MFAIKNLEQKHEKRKILFLIDMSRKIRIIIEDDGTKTRCEYIKNSSGRAIICEKIGHVRHKNTLPKQHDASDLESIPKNEVFP